MPRQRTIMLDGFNLSLEHGTGIATYARNLSYALQGAGYRVEILYSTPRLSKIEPILGEVTFFDEHGAPLHPWMQRLQDIMQSIPPIGPLWPKPVPMTGFVETRPVQGRLPAFDRVLTSPNCYNRGNAYATRFRSLCRVMAPKGVDIAHWTYPAPLRAVGAKNVYTIHDVVPIKLPYTTLDNKKIFLRLLRVIARQADLICTVSEHSRNDILELTGIRPEKVVNTFQGVRIPQHLIDATEEEVASRVYAASGLEKGQYMLFVGALEPKKNVGRLLDAYLSSRVDLPLVMVGPSGWKSGKELARIDHETFRETQRVGDRFVGKRRVYRLDYVTFPQLVFLIRGARGLLFPSIYEGFGLPVLEAMKLGCPVMTSHESSLPEVGGDAVLYCDPYDVSNMAEGIRKLVTDDELCARLKTAGLKQAEKFGMKTYEENLVAMYESMY